MKSDRFQRRPITTSRRAENLAGSLVQDAVGTHLPNGEITIYDYAQGLPCDDEVFSISDLRARALKNANIAKATNYAFRQSEDLLLWMIAIMGESPAASAMISEASYHDWSVALAELHSGGYHLDLSDRIIYIDHFSLVPHALGRSEYFRNAALAIFVRALRDIWHEGRHRPFEHEYGPEEALMLERVRAADCDTVSVLSAWELRGAGYGAMWRHLIGGAEGDMALVFSRVLERDPSAFISGAALAYAFRQWYADEGRVNGCDHETLEALDDILLASSERNPFGHMKLKEEKLESLSLLPDGTCYLAGLGKTVSEDPFFAGMKDEINQSHLFQIVYDMEVTVVGNVPFRDQSLAAKMFPPEQ